MAVAAEHEAIIAPELVRVNDTSPANFFDGELQKGCCGDIRHNIYMDQAIPLQDAENRYFASGSPSPVAFTLATEVDFIQLDLSAKKVLSVLGVTQNGQPDSRNSLVSCPMRQI